MGPGPYFSNPWANRLVAAFLGPEPSAGFQWLVSFILPFLLLLPATFAMGATLPVMHRFLNTLEKKRKDHRRSLRRQHLRRCGRHPRGGTGPDSPVWTHRQLVDLRDRQLRLCPGSGLLARKNAKTQPALSPPITIERLPSLTLSLLLFATGLLGIGYEVLVVRLISQVLENTVYSFAAVLAVYLLGTAGGAAIYQRLASRRPTPDPLPRLLTSLAGSCLLGTILLWHSGALHRAVIDVFGKGTISSLFGEITLSAAILFLPTLIMGATFSHLAQKAEDGRIGFGKALGINTLGASLAPFLFGVVLLPQGGSNLALAAVTLGYLALVPLTGRRFYIPALVPFLAALFIIFYPVPLRLVALEPGDQIIEHREGVMAAVTVVQDDRGNPPKSKQPLSDGRHLLGFLRPEAGAHSPAAASPPERALFLGLGTGSTLAAAVDHPGLQAEGVELIPEVISVLPYFEKATGNLGGNPSLRLITADARRYVNARPGTYDVIVADLFHPARDGAGSLYTLEHFRAIRALLRPEGVFFQWLPLYQLDLDTLRLITRTFLEAFPEGTAFLAHFSLKAPILGLAARMGGPGYPEDWFRQRVQDPALAEALRRVRSTTISASLGPSWPAMSN